MRKKKREKEKKYLKARVIKAETAVSLHWLFRPLPTQEIEDFNVSQKEVVRFGCILEVVEKKEKSQRWPLILMAKRMMLLKRNGKIKAQQTINKLADKWYSNTNIHQKFCSGKHKHFCKFFKTTYENKEAVPTVATWNHREGMRWKIDTKTKYNSLINYTE